ncbi:hypothetical protein RND81_01G160400 [Saponaria officinalis]|uniref:Uncharacterized protein n=1 Tax=Saponaria officinalis TaxID=3572 RepID=A0AAW1N813_SAPOF
MSKNKGKVPKTQTGGYQSSDDYEMEIIQLKPSNSNPKVDIQIPKPPTTPIKTSNTFNPLLTQPNRPALPYSQALENQPKTQNEKEAHIQNTSPFPGYFVKSTIEPLILTKYRNSPPVHEFRVNNSKIFAQGIHWFSDNISKYQRFYEFILVDSGSADIKHNRNTDGKIIYSKLIIKKVNSSDDWIEPFAEKDFSKRFVPQTYSYQDYKNAWSRQWWYLFGPVQDIYPPICTKGLETFIAQTKGDLYQKPLIFHAEFKIPWIICWSYNLRQILPQPYHLSLIREFKIKWWDKFDIAICSPEAIKYFLQGGRKLEWTVKDFNRQQTQASTSSSTRLPHHSRPPKQQMVKDPIFRNELLGVIRNQINAEEDDDSTASSSSVSGSIHVDDDHVFGGLCSQDPFDY